MSISVIIPAHNAEKTIKLCVDSILEQLGEDDEIIVVDNGSTDSTLSILKECSIDKVYVKENCNVSGVRNFGAEHATGELLLFIDSDCTLQKDYVKNAFQFLHDESIHASGCKVDIPEDSNWIEKSWFSTRKTGISEVNYINSGNFIIRKNVFELIGGFNESIVTDEDTEICLRLREKGFRIVSNDTLSVTHHGNPKSIIAFMKREYWHSIGMFGSFGVNKFDKPLIATFLFTLFHFAGLWMLVQVNTSILAVLLLVYAIPFLSSLYRSVQYQNWQYVFSLSILYYLYFLVRSFRLLQFVIQKKKSDQEEC
jgi:glycosyltransferase involved in cell wall biosynthesis